MSRRIKPAPDASCYLGLSRIGMLHLIPALWGRADVTEAVQRELTIKHRNQVPDPATLPWVDLVAPLPSTDITERLGAGEHSVISHARHDSNVFALIDEKRGKKAARRLGLGDRMAGALGVLLRAKERGLIPAVAPHVQALEHLDPPFHMSGRLIEDVLRLAGEESALATFRYNPNQKRTGL